MNPVLEGLLVSLVAALLVTAMLVNFILLSHVIELVSA